MESNLTKVCFITAQKLRFLSYILIPLKTALVLENSQYEHSSSHWSSNVQILSLHSPENYRLCTPTCEAFFLQKKGDASRIDQKWRHRGNQQHLNGLRGGSLQNALHNKHQSLDTSTAKEKKATPFPCTKRYLTKAKQKVAPSACHNHRN